MFKITRSILNRKVKENRKNIGINSQCLQVKYDEATNSIKTSNIRSTRYKKYVVELIKSNLESNNLEYNEANLELVVLDDSCKYYEYKLESVELDEEVADYERRVEKEEDERDEKEKERRERRAEKKRLKVVRKRELDRVFFEEWADKIKALKAVIPDTENLMDGRGKERKYRAYFRHQATLFLQEIKNLNIGGGK